MDKLTANFHYYLDHQQELLKEYEGKYLVIVDCKVVGDYVDMSDAVNEASRKYGMGNFLLQYCSQGDTAYTQTFYNSYMRF